MKRAVYLSILGVITAVCIVIGIAGRVGRFTFGNHYGDLVTLDNEKLDAFDKMDFDTSVLDVNIVNGTKYAISYQAQEKLVPKYYVEDGTLHIEQENIRNVDKMWNGNAKMHIEITVPKEAYLEEVDIQANVGDVKLDGTKTKQFTCDAQVGDVDIKNAELGETDIRADVGDIDICNSVLQDTYLDASVGDIEMREVTLQDTEISADVGDVQIDVAGNRADYNLDLEADLGDIRVDGKRSRSHIEEGENGLYDLTVCGDIGSIEVNFTK